MGSDEEVLGVPRLVPMSIAYYREHAAECVRRAREASNEEVKSMLLRMAEIWINLATYVEALTSAPGTGLKEEN